MQCKPMFSLRVALRKKHMAQTISPTLEGLQLKNEDEVFCFFFQASFFVFPA